MEKPVSNKKHRDLAKDDFDKYLLEDTFDANVLENRAEARYPNDLRES